MAKTSDAVFVINDNENQSCEDRLKTKEKNMITPVKRKMCSKCVDFRSTGNMKLFFKTIQKGYFEVSKILEQKI
jgi:hypothetical protein